MLSSPSSRFTSLPARPPTPPRDMNEAVQDALTFLRSDIDISDQTELSNVQPHNTDTPPSSSPFRAQEAGNLHERKRVEFLSTPTYHQPPQSRLPGSPTKFMSTPHLPLRSSKPTKSILKISPLPTSLALADQDPPLAAFTPGEPGSFAKMLTSVLRQLGSSSGHARLDAYLALNGALSQFDDLPDRANMDERMDTVVQFLHRDLAARESTESFGSMITVQAIKLAARIVTDDALSKAVNNEFRAYLIDRSVAVIEQAGLPKQLVKTHLGLMAQQRFNSTVMTPGRADKLVSALQTMDSRCSGNSAIVARLVIYRKLLDQAPSTMLTRLRDWLEHILHGMLSDLSDTRLRAIEVCSYTGMLFGTNGSAGRMLHELFETETADGSRYFKYFEESVDLMLQKPDVRICVPQIWASIVLFHRSRKTPLEKWPRFKAWLRIMEKCLNSTDLPVRHQADLAWRKLIFAVQPDSTTSTTMLNVLNIPVRLGFSKTGSDRHSKQSRRLALEGYYNLLHYALRPGLSANELSTAWDVFVRRHLPDMIRASSKGRLIACTVLHGLLTPNTGAWNAAAAMEDEAIEPKDLPRLDPRWVRSHLSDVLPMVESVIQPVLSMPEAMFAKSRSVWNALLQSVIDAGAQEVRVSLELKEAIVQFLNPLRRMWNDFSANPDPENDSLLVGKRLQELTLYTYGQLGLAHFTEDFLHCTENQASLAVTASISKPSNQRQAIQSPLTFSLTFICRLQGDDAVVAYSRSTASQLLSLVVNAKATFAAKMQSLARVCLELTTTCKPDEVDWIWNEIAHVAITILSNAADDGSNMESSTTLRLLADGRTILVAGLPLRRHTDSTDTVINGLITALVRVADKVAGHGGPMLAVIEPLAKSVRDQEPETPLRMRLCLTQALLRSTPCVEHRQDIERARKVLYGITALQKPTKKTQYDHLYALVCNVSQDAYETLGNQHDLHTVSPFLDNVSMFPRKCPHDSQQAALLQLQDAIVPWVADTGKKVFTAAQHTLSEQVFRLWSQVLQLLRERPNTNCGFLTTLNGILVAGFTSPRRAIVNDTINYWNETFGNETELKYPNELRNVLSVLKAHVEISLPSFPETLDQDLVQSLPAFAESQEEVEQDSGRVGISRSTFLQPHATESSETEVNEAKVFPANALKASADAKLKRARPRHDDSQSLFVPIELSSPVSAIESQMLTDHQRETRERQLADAQMFPGMSSSPVAQSTGLLKHISRKLDFTILEHDTELDEARTPVEAQELDFPADEPTVSSPTPHNSEDFPQLQIDVDVTAEDIPSSPPKAIPEIASRANVADDEAAMIEDDNQQSVEHDVPTEHRDDISRESSFEREIDDLKDMSDSILPDEQLQLEAETAAARELSQIEQSRIGDSSPLKYEPEKAQDQATDPEVHPEETSSPSDETTIENSFILPHEPNSVDRAPSIADTETSLTSTSRKRKRRSPLLGLARRQKQKPSLEHVRWKNHPRQSNVDIGEEIIVARRQHPGSPTEEYAKRSRIQSTRGDEDDVPEVQQTAVEQDEMEVFDHIPARRRSSRVLMSQTPESATPTTRSKRKLKRKSSTLSEVSSAIGTDDTGHSPAIGKVRRLRLEDDIGSQALRSSQQSDDDLTEVSPRAAIGVLLSQTVESAAVEESVMEESQELGRDNAVDDDESVSSQSSLFSATGILERLREVLEGCKKVVLKPKEMRSIDDALFDIKVAALDAGRRREE